MEKKAREKALESRLRMQVLRLGGYTFKWVSPGTNGVPDRIILLPGPYCCFCEVKSEGKKPDPVQIIVHKMLRKIGFVVWVVDSEKSLEEFITFLKSKI